MSPLDRALLEAIFDPHSDLIAAAASRGLDEIDLIDWSNQPHIRERIRAQRTLRHLRREMADEARAGRMMELLEHITISTDDPVESRRAATTVLRAIVAPASSRCSKSTSRQKRPWRKPGLDPRTNHNEPHKAQRASDDHTPRTASEAHLSRSPGLPREGPRERTDTPPPPRSPDQPVSHPPPEEPTTAPPLPPGPARLPVLDPRATSPHTRSRADQCAKPRSTARGIPLPPPAPAAPRPPPRQPARKLEGTT